MPNIFNTAQKFGLIYAKPVGPWPCEQCKKITQYAKVSGDKNVIYCTNEYCRFERIVDMKNHRIVEPDGSQWIYNPVDGKKYRVTAR
jgi:hypothetical protein